MAKWREQAATLLPEIWRDESVRETPYQLFFELLDFVRDAHRRQDHDALRRSYEFAGWCLRQGADLQNAVSRPGFRGDRVSWVPRS